MKVFVLEEVEDLCGPKESRVIGVYQDTGKAMSEARRRALVFAAEDRKRFPERPAELRVHEDYILCGPMSWEVSEWGVQ